MKIEDVAIIGAGPAGITAAIQLCRQGFRPIVFEKDKPGGLLRNANLVENYPGFPGGISGLDLVALFKKQLADHPANMIKEEIIELDFEDDTFTIATSGDVHRAQTVLIATGTVPRPFTDVTLLDGVKPQIHYEVYPILSLQDNDIAIVGAGDAAFDYALSLQKRNQVIIMNRGDKTRCLKLLKERAARCDNITYRTNIKLSGISQNSKGRLRMECMTLRTTETIEVDQLVFALGRDPKVDFLSDGIRTVQNRLEADGRLYFIGDVKNGRYRQTAIAVGDALLAAMKIARIAKERTI